MCSLFDQSPSNNCLLDMWCNSLLTAHYWLKNASLPNVKIYAFCNPFLSKINLFTYILTFFNKTGRNSF